MEFMVAQKAGPHGLLLVITDENILGKVFEEGKVQLDLRNSFYRGKKMSKQEIKGLLPKAQHLHLTGKGAVALGVAENYVDPKRILWVKGVPHAEVVCGE